MAYKVVIISKISFKHPPTGYIYFMYGREKAQDQNTVIAKVLAAPDDEQDNPTLYLGIE